MITDRTLPLVQVEAAFCPRRLKPGMVKRYMHTGPLVGYTISCPACGFISLYEHSDAGFVEEGGRLLSAHKPMTCAACNRTLRIIHAQVSAKGSAA